MGAADELPPTEYLLMEVLAARVRLGERCWTFPARLQAPASSLQAKGWVLWKPGVVAGTILVAPTRAGEEQFLDPGYVPAAGRGPAGG